MASLFEGPPTPAAGSGTSLFDGPPKPGVTTAAPTPPVAPAPSLASAPGPLDAVTDYIENSLWPGVKYVGKRIAAGAMATGQGLAAPELSQGSMMSGGLTGQPGPTLQEMQFNPTEKVFGTPHPKAPGPISDYAGALGESLGGDPAGSLMNPEAWLTGTLAGKAVGNATGNPWLAAGASLLAGIGASGVRSSIGTALTNKGLREADEAATAAAARVNNDLSIAKEDLGKQRLANMADIPEAEKASRAVRNAAIEKANQDLAAAHAVADANIESVAAATGTSRTAQESGEVTQAAARDWIGGKFAQEKAAAMEPVRNLVREVPDLTVGRDNFAQRLAAITEAGGSNQVLVEALRPTLPARLLKIFEPEGPGQLKPSQVGAGRATKPGPEAVARTEQSWQDAAVLKTALGDAMANPQIVKDIPAQQLSSLYQAQTMDMRQALADNAHRMSADPLAAFDQANAQLSRLYSVAEGPMSRIVAGPRPSAADPRPEDVAVRLMNEAKRGGTDLAILRREMPEAVDELVAAHLREHPEEWTRFSPEAKDALLPGIDRQHAIDVAIAGREGATENHQAAVAAARADHSDTVREARDAGRQAVIDKSRSVNELTKQTREADLAAKNAREALPVKPDGWSFKNVAHTITHPGIGGLGLAELLGAHALPAGLPGLGIGLGIAGATMAIPFVGKMLGRGVAQGGLGPSLVAGEAAGGNQLNSPSTAGSRP